MQGIISSFRRGRKTYTPRHFIIIVESIKTRKDAEKLVGKKVEWKSPAGKIIHGIIASAHGNKGVLRAIFEIGLPGQALTQTVEIK
jgi:large subunit ribosomal protein L35Ae